MTRTMALLLYTGITNILMGNTLGPLDTAFKFQVPVAPLYELKLFQH